MRFIYKAHTTLSTNGIEISARNWSIYTYMYIYEMSTVYDNCMRSAFGMNLQYVYLNPF